MFRKFQQSIQNFATSSSTWHNQPKFNHHQPNPHTSLPLSSSQRLHQSYASSTATYTLSTIIGTSAVGFTAAYHLQSSQYPQYNLQQPLLPLPPNLFSNTSSSQQFHSSPSPINMFLNKFSCSSSTILASTAESQPPPPPSSSKPSPSQSAQSAQPSHDTMDSLQLLPQDITNPFLDTATAKPSTQPAKPASILASSIPALNRIDSRYLDMSSFLLFSLIGLLGVRVLLYPLNVIKTRLQATTPVPSPNPMFSSVAEQSLSEQQPPSVQHKRISAKAVFLEIIRNEGIRPLFAGLGLSLVLTVSRQLYFYMYEHLRSSIVQLNVDYKFIENESLFNLSKDSLSAFVATALYQVVANPLDIIVQRLMTHRRAVEKVSNLHMEESANASKAEQIASTFDPFAVPEAKKPKSTFAQQLIDRFAALKLTRNLFHADPAVFYRGFTSSTVLWSFNSMIWWGSFEMLLQQFTKVFPQSSPQHSQTIHVFDQFLSDDSQNLLHSHGWYAQHFAAAISSWLSVVLTHPLDTARTRLMVNCRKNDGMTATSSIMNTVREEGFRGLWTGLSARIMLVVPTSVLTMTVYQISKVFSVEMKFRNGELIHTPSSSKTGYQHLNQQQVTQQLDSQRDLTASLSTAPSFSTSLQQLLLQQQQQQQQQQHQQQHSFQQQHHHHHHHHHHHSKSSSLSSQSPSTPAPSNTSSHPSASSLLQRKPNGEYFLQDSSPISNDLQSSTSYEQLVASIKKTMIGKPQSTNQLQTNTYKQFLPSPISELSKQQLQSHILQLPHYIEFRLVSSPQSSPQQNALLIDMSVPSTTSSSESISDPSSSTHFASSSTTSTPSDNSTEREKQTREVMSLFQQINDLVYKLGYHIEVLDTGEGEPDEDEIDDSLVTEQPHIESI